MRHNGPCEQDFLLCDMCQTLQAGACQAAICVRECCKQVRRLVRLSCRLIRQGRHCCSTIIRLLLTAKMSMHRHDFLAFIPCTYYTRNPALSQL